MASGRRAEYSPQRDLALLFSSVRLNLWWGLEVPSLSRWDKEGSSKYGRVEQKEQDKKERINGWDKGRDLKTYVHGHTEKNSGHNLLNAREKKTKIDDRARMVGA